MALSSSSAAGHLDDTIVAVSSAPGPGRRAIVRISGPGTRGVVETVFTLHDPSTLNWSGIAAKDRRLVPGDLRLRGIHSPLPAYLYFFAAPRTYTGQDLAELHTIGSPPLVEQLVADLLAAGARPARPGEFTLRAFLAGKKDLPQAEAVHAVIEAGTDDDLAQALTQLAGGITQPLQSLRDDLLNLLADLEAALDFADEDIEFVTASDTLLRLDAAISHLEQLRRQLEERTVSGRPVRIALVGLPNAGKTSLFNALAGCEALVSPIPGTTRDYLVKPLDLGGISAELIDTAGWQSATDTIEVQAQQLGREQTGRADLIVWCAEAGGEFPAADDERLRATGAKLLRARTKSDLTSNSAISRDDGGIRVSVVLPGGLSDLHTALKDASTSLARSSLAPSQSRCRHHVEASLSELSRARDHVLAADPPELTAAALRIALDQLGEMTGAIHTTDLLDRVFSRFCVGK